MIHVRNFLHATKICVSIRIQPGAARASDSDGSTVSCVLPEKRTACMQGMWR
jgi:hypothetical protein